MVADATGHDLHAGLAAAAALAAYRNARRAGHGVLQQAEAVDAVDLRPVRRRHVRDGRRRAARPRTPASCATSTPAIPTPLLLRAGRLVRELDGGRRPLFGLETRHTEVAHERLEPGDMVLLYTDGIVEARDSAGAMFGLDRLVGVLERSAADDLPLPEVLRRIRDRILEHQGGVLQDDATLVLVHWTTQGQIALEPDASA